MGWRGGVNSYGYAAGDPNRYVDPNGTDIYTAQIGISLPFVGGFDFGFVADTGGGNSLPDFGVFGTVKKNYEGLGRFKTTAGVSQTIGGRCNFDGTDAEVEVGLGEVGGSLGGINENNVPTSVSLEVGPQLGLGSNLTQTGSFTVGDIARGIARLISGPGGGAWHGCGERR